jgi:hypothetical protein
MYLVFLHVWLYTHFVPLLILLGGQQKRDKIFNLWNGFKYCIAFEYRSFLILVPVASFGQCSIVPVRSEDEPSSIQLHNRPSLTLR